MNDFERQVLELLTDIKSEISAIHTTMTDAMNASQEKNSELIQSVFGFLQPNQQDD